MSSSSSKQMSPGMKFFFTRIFPLIFVVIGAIATFFGIRGLVRAEASLDWPSTQGMVVKSSVNRQISSGQRVNASQASRRVTTYYAEILYEFTVDGITFNGNRVAYDNYRSSDPSHARIIVNRYPKGKSVTVYYMPGNPEEYLLEPGINSDSFFLPGFGLVFFIGGTLMAIFLPRSKRMQEITE